MAKCDFVGFCDIKHAQLHCE